MSKPRIQLVAMIVLALLAFFLFFSRTATPNQNLLFNFKRAQENIFLATKSTPEAKLDFLSNMLEARLEELQKMVLTQNYDYVLPAASRYSSLAGQITDLVVTNHLTDKIEAIKDQFLSNQEIINNLYVIYPKNTESMEYKYIQDDYNYLNLYLDQLGKVK